MFSQPEVLRLGGWGGVGLGEPEREGGQQSSKQGCRRSWAGWPACPRPCRPQGLDRQGLPCLAVISFCAMLSILSLKEELPVGGPPTSLCPWSSGLGAWEQSWVVGRGTALQGEASETPFQALGFGLRGYDCCLEITDLQ